MSGFVDGSRHRGAPVSQARPLNALVTETDADEARTPTALLRLIDDAGHTIELRPVAASASRRGCERWARPSPPPAAAPDTRWEIWTGHGRQLLRSAAAVTITP